MRKLEDHTHCNVTSGGRTWDGLALDVVHLDNGTVIAGMLCPSAWSSHDSGSEATRVAVVGEGKVIVAFLHRLYDKTKIYRLLPSRVARKI